MHPTSGHLLLALGANVRGCIGNPCATLQWALAELSQPDLIVLRVSSVWSCAPFGRVRQPRFVNAVILARTACSPQALLHLVKTLETRAGRRRGKAWGPRALDIDILDLDGLPRRPAGMGRHARGTTAHAWQRKGLVLPHPGVHERPFVLLPLAEIWPDWRHPLLGRTACQLLHTLPPRLRRSCHRLAANLLPPSLPSSPLHLPATSHGAGCAHAIRIRDMA